MAPITTGVGNDTATADLDDLIAGPREAQCGALAAKSYWSVRRRIQSPVFMSLA
jgi:hypothetical protein